MPTESVRPDADVVPRLAVRDPDQWLTLICWLVIGFSGLSILLYSFGRDQGIYAVVADTILNGGMPYRDAWDFKPPGIFLTYALAQALFGKSMLAIRLLEVIALVAATFGFERLGQVFFDRPKAGLVAAAVAALVHAQLEFWHTAQPETFAGYLTIAALVVVTLEPSKRRRWLIPLGTGVLFGMCALYKPPLGGGILVCGAYVLTREQLRAAKLPQLLRCAVLLASGFALPIALVLIWLAARGAWPAFYWTFHDFVPGYTKLNWSDAHAPGMLYYALDEAFMKFSALSAFGVIAAIAMSPIHSREREGIFLVLGIIAIHLTGITMQGKFFPYHYGATLTLIAFISGLGLYKLFRRCLVAGPGSLLALASFVLVAISMRDGARDLPQGFWERTSMRLAFLLRQEPFRSRGDLDRELSYVADYNLDADRQVALEIRSRTRETDAVFIWGFEPSIYFLAERPLASRWTYDVPQRTPWQRGYSRGELLKDLSLRRPQLIIVQRRDVFPSVTGSPLDSRDELPSFPELKSLIDAQYLKVREIEDFEIYERSERGS
ncbi:MAG TPA: glycosyltransferase family 39 protein [Polyangiaceae bacterium]